MLEATNTNWRGLFTWLPKYMQRNENSSTTSMRTKQWSSETLKEWKRPSELIEKFTNFPFVFLLFFMMFLHFVCKFRFPTAEGKVNWMACTSFRLKFRHNRHSSHSILGTISLLHSPTHSIQYMAPSDFGQTEAGAGVPQQCGWLLMKQKAQRVLIHNKNANI